MKHLTWDSGWNWDDPNIRWGDPSYILEPGDPGYTPPSPAPKRPTRHRTMSNNPIPDAERPLLALAEDAADGCSTHQDSVQLKQTREGDLRLLLTALKGDPDATPIVLGLIYQYKQAEQALAAANNARRLKDQDAKTFLTAARAALLPILGRDPSPEWGLAGFLSPQGDSNAVPGNQEGRFQCLNTLAIYLTQHPTYEVPAGTPRPEVTAARARTLHDQLSTCRQASNQASNNQSNALAAKNDALLALRRRLIAFVDELQLLLTDDDPRWEIFGLNIPANPRPPEPASDLVLTLAGAGRVHAEWERGTRSNDDRILIQIIGVDTQYREYGKSGGDAEEVLKNLPVGATLKIKIIALNGSLEAPTGPEAQIVVG